MIKTYLFFFIITLSISFSCSTPAEDCPKQSNTSCDTCLKVEGCSYCKDSKECFPTPAIPTSAPCSLTNYQTKTCHGNAEIYLIVFGSLGGVVLLLVIIVVCCLCGKCKQRRLQKDQKRERVNERQLEERRAAAEIRTAERDEKREQIRMKYGLFKGQDNAVEYRRMS